MRRSLGTTAGFLTTAESVSLWNPLRFASPPRRNGKYACRAGTKTEFCFRRRSQTTSRIWLVQKTTPEAHRIRNGEFKELNAWGLYDMSVIAEWCSDWYDVDLHRQSRHGLHRSPAREFDAAYRGAVPLPLMPVLPVNRRRSASGSRQADFSSGWSPSGPRRCSPPRPATPRQQAERRRAGDGR